MRRTYTDVHNEREGGGGGFFFFLWPAEALGRPEKVSKISGISLPSRAGGAKNNTEGSSGSLCFIDRDFSRTPSPRRA